MISRAIHSFMKKAGEMKYFLPPDVFERHKYIGDLIFDGATILDVGGSISRLTSYCNPKSITTADVKEPVDILYDGKKIPVDDTSYDVVTSIDVLEHVPVKQREEFVGELVRIARKRVIISAPYGSPEHSAYEKKILAYFSAKGIKMPYLAEHVEIGLPTPELLESFEKKYDGTLKYSGDIFTTDKLMKIHNFEVKNPFMNVCVYFLKLGFNALFNTFYYPFLINRKKSPFINRFYLIIDK